MSKLVRWCLAALVVGVTGFTAAVTLWFALVEPTPHASDGGWILAVAVFGVGLYSLACAVAAALGGYFGWGWLSGAAVVALPVAGLDWAWFQVELNTYQHERRICVEQPTPGVAAIHELACGGGVCAALHEGGVAALWSHYWRVEPTALGRAVYAPLAGGPSAPYVWPAVHGVTDLDGGGELCAVHDGGSVTCGFVSKGEGEVGGLTDAVEVAVGHRHACATRHDATVSCWSNASRQRVGEGVDGLDDVVGLASGAQFSCAVRGGDTVWCWGEESDREDYRRPVQVPDASGALEIAAFQGSAFARFEDGRVGRWDPPLTTLTEVAELHGAVDLQPPCARFADGTVACVSGVELSLEGPVDELEHHAPNLCVRSGDQVRCSRIGPSQGPSVLRPVVGLPMVDVPAYQSPEWQLGNIGFHPEGSRFGRFCR